MQRYKTICKKQSVGRYYKKLAELLESHGRQARPKAEVQEERDKSNGEAEE